MRNIFKLAIFLLPLFEIAMFIWVGKFIGVGWTLLLIVCTTLMGLTLMRNHGFRLAQEFASKARNRQLEPSDMMEGSFIFIGGILLIIPGFITDIVGLLCFIPPLRRAIIKNIILAVSVPVATKSQRSSLDDHSQQ